MKLMKTSENKIVEVKKQGTTCLQSGSVLDKVWIPAHVHPVTPDFHKPKMRMS
jgi:hypothetical protein